jgi:hypothetical protein
VPRDQIVSWDLKPRLVASREAALHDLPFPTAYGFSLADADLSMKDDQSLKDLGRTADEVTLPLGRTSL